MALKLTDYNLTSERAEFRDMLRRFFEEHVPMTIVRSVMESGQGISAEAWRLSAEELGLAGLAIDEAHGGQGFGLEELALALGEVGRSLAPLPLFGSSALAGRVVAQVAQGAEASEYLGPIAQGQAASLAFVEASGDWDPASVRMEAADSSVGYCLTGEKQLVLDATVAARFFVVARRPGSAGDEGLGVFAVEADAKGVDVTPRASFDLTRPVSTLRLSAAPARLLGDLEGSAAGIRTGLDEATALLCAEMAGGMQCVLETAVDYAAERHQFSRPIGSFQAIKHKCADLLIAFEAGRTAAAGAITAHVDSDPEAAILTSVAKSYMGPAYIAMTTENMQIQGGVGYTWEYDAHLFARRATACEAMLASADVHQDRLARRVAASASIGAAEGGR